MREKSAEAFEIRFYMAVNKEEHPDVVWLLGGLADRERNRRIRGMLLKLAQAERTGQSLAPTSAAPQTAQVPASPGPIPKNTGLLPGLEVNDVFEAFGAFGGSEHHAPAET